MSTPILDRPSFPPMPQNNLLSGASYFFRGLNLLWRPELRKYILIPLLVNIALFVGLTSLFIGYFNILTDFDINFPEWLAWLEFLEKTLKWVAWLLLLVILIIGYGYSFNIITNIIAAPFYGMLAQRTEELLTGIRPPDEPIHTMVIRTAGRELHKLAYFIVYGVFVFLLMLLLSTLFVMAFLVPLIGLFWGAWSMAIQYADYPADNHRTEFRRLRKCLGKKSYSSIGFGFTVMGCSMVPLVNLFAMPAAVTGGTLFWVEELKQHGVKRPPV